MCVPGLAARPVGPVGPVGHPALLTRLRAGEERAFEELVRAHGGRMLATAQRLLRDEDAAHDAVQDAFLCAFRALPRFEGGSLLSTWLHRIVVNAALMHLRSKKRRPEESIEALLPHFDDEGHWLEQPEAFPSPDALGERERVRERVRRCIAQLPEGHREIILLRDIEELDTEEAARALGIRPEAAKMRLHRARMALRTLLERELRRG
jgi:RNA polymerase sigma-70 factor (ECF subfamily)